jgi:HEAT repeat protein
MILSRKSFWLLTAVTFLTVVAWLSLRPVSDPVFEGQHLSAWFHRLRRAQDTEERRRAKEAICQIGPAAVPFLVKQLRYREVFWKRKYREFYYSPGRRWPQWISSRIPVPPYDNTQWTRVTAATALGYLGADAKAGAPALAETFLSDDYLVAPTAAQTLRALGPSARAALPKIIAGLRARNAFAADSAVDVAASVGRGAPEAVPLLTQMFAESDAVKIRALQVVANLGAEAASAEKWIDPLLGSPNPQVQYAAVRALWYTVPSRQLSLLPVVDKWAKSQNRSLCEKAAALLIQMRPLTEEAGDSLKLSLRNTSDGFRWVALTDLGHRGREVSNAIPALVETLKAENPRVAAKVATALGEIVGPGRDVLSALGKAEHHEYSMVRDAAAEAVQRLQSKAD